MSFTSEVKEGVIRNELSESARKAQLCGIVQQLASMTISSGQLALTIKSTVASLIKMVSLDIRHFYDVRSELSATRQSNLNKLQVYTLTVNEKVHEILDDLDLWTQHGLQDHPRLAFLKNDEMIRAYLTGCFLASGSVNSPRTTAYHLEIKTDSSGHAAFICKLLERFYITPKVTERRGKSVVYVKKGTQIADFLKLMNSDAVMDYEDIRIQRDFVNNLYRLDNIKIANDQKSQAVADKQLEVLNYLKENNLLDQLSEKEREIAQLRLDHPDASLSELSDYYYEMTGQELSKSGIRHRFEKIDALANIYRKRAAEKEAS